MEEPHVHKLFYGKTLQIDENETVDKNIEIKEKIWLSKTGYTAHQNLGADQVLSAYPIKHYTKWQEEYPYELMDMGKMGEHLSVLEMDEFSVFIGDTFRLGEAIIQVSQPGEAYPLGANKSESDKFWDEMLKTWRTGWHFRVIEEGYVQAPNDLELLERPYPEFSVAACNEIMYVMVNDLRMADDLFRCKALSVKWRKAMKKRLLGTV